MLASVKVPVLNLYASPNEWSEVISQALYSWPVDVLDEQAAFKRVRTADQYEGWALANSLTAYQAPVLPLAKVIHNAVHVYAFPSVKQQKPLLTLPFEVYLEVLTEPEEEQSRWIQVKLLEEGKGWIHRHNICLNSFSLDHRQMLDLSRQFLGLPYTWGGTSSFGYDCSGFTQMLFRQTGIQLPRDAYQQASVFQPVDMKDILPSDLIFFGSSLEKISHVGVYLGNQEIIHASVKDAPVVQITHLNHPSLTERFQYVTVRRVAVKADSQR